jgi:hypothetical protein
VASGGKFLSGAETAAFGYLFNAAGGGANKEQHDIGVGLAIDDLRTRGYVIEQSGTVAVDVPGTSSARFYDILVTDPNTARTIGVEVKTTLFDKITLDFDQAMKDLTVVSQGGVVRSTGIVVQNVMYWSSCYGCSFLDYRQPQLMSLLKGAGIPFITGKRFGGP